MFFSRSVFLFAIALLAFVARVSAIPPLLRYMLDAVPEGTEDSASLSSNMDASSSVETAVVTDADTPVAVESTPASVEASPATSVDTSEASTETSDATTEQFSSPDAPAENAQSSQASGASPISLSHSTILIGTIVASILLSA